MIACVSPGGEVFFSDNEGDCWSKIAEGIAPVSKVNHYRALQRVA